MQTHRHEEFLIRILALPVLQSTRFLICGRRRGETQGCWGDSDGPKGTRPLLRWALPSAPQSP